MVRYDWRGEILDVFSMQSTENGSKILKITSNGVIITQKMFPEARCNIWGLKLHNKRQSVWA